jgi:type I restriction enzyme S subunit
MRWPEVRIGDLGAVFTGRTPSTERPSYFGKDFPFITPGDMHQGKYARETDRSLSQEGAELLKRIRVPAQSVCVSCIGWQMGEVIMTDRPSFTNQQINTVVPNGRVEPSFLFYSLRPRKNELLSLGAATGVRTPILNKSAFCDLKLRLAPMLVQQRIAGILSAYDELIDSGQRRIRILEAMARALYRETLQAQGSAAMVRPVVDCEYWRFISENVGEYLSPKRYFATADVDGLAITGAGIEYSFSEKPSRAQKQPIPHSVWFARMKDTYKIAWYGVPNARQASESLLSSGFAGFEARDPDLWPLLFLTISSKDFHVQKDLYCTGATQMSLTNESLGRIEMPIPDEESARRLGKEAGPMLNSILVLQKRNENLRRTRDLLLPRLLSGQLKAEAA